MSTFASQEKKESLEKVEAEISRDADKMGSR
jgi:hypothetical protein